jgi:hypothetical protein
VLVFAVPRKEEVLRLGEAQHAPVMARLRNLYKYGFLGSGVRVIDLNAATR